MIKKSYKISGFDCANCAKKTENHLNKDPRISSAVIDFAQDRLHIEYNGDELTVDEILDIIKEVEGDPIVVEDLNAKKPVSYCITGFDCANCAKKSEKHLNKNKYIENAVIDFASDRLHVTYKSKELSAKELKDIIAEVEDDEITITPLDVKAPKRKFFNINTLILLFRVIIAIVVIVLSMTVLMDEKYFWLVFGLYAFTIVEISYDIYIKVAKHIIAKENPIDEYLLLTLCGTGAFIIAAITKENHMFMEAAMVVTLFQVGKLIEGFATFKSKDEIMSAVQLRVETANKVVGGDVITVKPEELEIGDTVVVSIGEQIPVDGEVIEGNAEIDTSSLTGEFVPVSSKEGLEVFAGCLIKSGSIKIKVTRTYQNSAVSKIVELISNSGAKKSKADEFVTKFARFYTPVILASGVLVAVIGGAITSDWNSWVLLGLKMLVVGCPCAIVISVPLAYFSAIGLASKNGVVVKGTNYLDKLVSLKKVITDKTGTLTEGVFEITKVNSIKGNEEELVNYLVAAEYLSNHPIGLAICRHRDTSNLVSDTKDYQEIAGYGVSIIYQGKKLLAGNSKLLKNNNISFEEAKEIGSIVYLAVDNEYYGYVVLSDRVKSDAKDMVALFNKAKVETILLTGDKEDNAKALCDELGIKKHYSELLPDEKLTHLENELNKKYTTAFVGDGINDAASIKGSDVGFAMGAIGSDVAVESADVVIMNDNPVKVYDAYRVAKIARHTAVFNIVVALTVKISLEIAAIVTGSLGRGELIPMWAAVLADTGLTVALVINSLLILYRKNHHKSVK